MQRASICIGFSERKETFRILFVYIIFALTEAGQKVNVRCGISFRLSIEKTVEAYEKFKELCRRFRGF